MEPGASEQSRKGSDIKEIEKSVNNLSLLEGAETVRSLVDATTGVALDRISLSCRPVSPTASEQYREEALLSL
jgi:hypothetical protein